MIRSALLALDTTEASQMALARSITFCLRYAERNESGGRPMHLSGVAVVDVPGIRAPMATPIGGGAYKQTRDEALLRDAEEKTERILSEFESKCKEAGIPHTSLRGEGMPYEQIEAAARWHDIILIGRDTNFHYETSNVIGNTMRRLVYDNSRPVIVYPAVLPENNRILISYDGSTAASHALHVWTLLKLRQPESEIHVVSVSRERARAERRCDEVAKLLSFHNCEATLHPILREHTVVEHLSQTVKQINPRMVVMGAYGHGGLKTALFGSATNRILEEIQCPLFLYK
ncbi:MAG: universal stress protein [Pirellulaceae bacterium]